MTWQQWAVVTYLVFAAVAYVHKTGTTKTYTRNDATLAVVEIAVVIAVVISI